jgi:GNAT superfamily N-acetyltransferase
MAEEYRDGAISVSTDPERLDLDVIHGFLTRSYWSEGISKDRVARSIRGSLCFGLYEGDRQVGFARAVTDGAVIGFLADVFVIESHRRRGLGKILMRCVMAHPDLRTISKWRLVTRDAHGLYARFGFEPLARPEWHMELLRPELVRD